MNGKDYQLFKTICKLDQTKLKSTMRDTLKEFYTKENIRWGNGYLMFLNDKCPIALIAHMDTVFAAQPFEIYRDTNENVIWSPDGLGGDDRCGIYAILKLIGEGHRPNIILLEDEEVGGKGASKLVTKVPKGPEYLSFLVELDRRGSMDSVFYDCDNPEFEAYINRFGFKTAWGTFSDISIIAPNWGIAAVNLSIGYEDEHSQIERVFVDDMEATITKVGYMLEETEVPKFKYIRGTVPAYAKYYQSLYGYDEYGYGAPWSSDMWGNDGGSPSEGYCYECCKLFDEQELIPVPTNGGYTDYLCPSCYINRIVPEDKTKMKPASKVKPKKKKKNKKWGDAY